MTIYAPWAFVFLLTIPIIILLYMFKQKHNDYVVSSLYLWQEAVKSVESSAPWHKLLRNLLMILQILVVLLMVFTLSRPIFNIGESNKSPVIIIIDSSMSMKAKDSKPSRFENAKKQTEELISNLKPGTKVTLLTMGANTEIKENLSSNKSSLKSTIEALQPTNCVANQEAAAILLHSVLKQNPESEVYLFGDKALNITDVSIKFFDYSNKGENYALLLLSHTISKDEITVLTRIANYSKKVTSIPISLYVNGRVFDAKSVDIEANETKDVYWEGIPSNTTNLECKIDTEDAIDADNYIWDCVNQQSQSKVLLINNENIFIEKALSVMKGIKLFKTDIDKKSTLKGYDLYIFDGYMPDTLPIDGSIMVFNPTKNKYFEVKGEIPVTSIVKSSNVLFSNIENYSFSIQSTKQMKVPMWAETVLESADGPLIMSGNLENKRILVFGFDLHNSDMVLTPSFPILIANSLEWLIPSRIENVENLLPGQAVEFVLNPKAEKVSVKTPSGDVVELAPPFPACIFNNTDETGLYTLEQKLPEKQLKYYFAVNAPAEGESNLLSEKVNLTADSKIKPIKKAQLKTNLNFQVFVLWGILILLIIEWWVYRYDV